MAYWSVILRVGERGLQCLPDQVLEKWKKKILGEIWGQPIHDFSISHGARQIYLSAFHIKNLFIMYLYLFYLTVMSYRIMLARFEVISAVFMKIRVFGARGGEGGGWFRPTHFCRLLPFDAAKRPIKFETSDRIASDGRIKYEY